MKLSAAACNLASYTDSDGWRRRGRWEVGAGEREGGGRQREREDGEKYLPPPQKKEVNCSLRGIILNIFSFLALTPPLAPPAGENSALTKESLTCVCVCVQVCCTTVVHFPVKLLHDGKDLLLHDLPQPGVVAFALRTHTHW